MDSIVFTPASLIDLLSQIDELSKYNIGISETIDNQIQLNIGESSYIIDTNAANSVFVDDQTVETVDTINVDAYENLDDSVEVEITDESTFVFDPTDVPVESGILKEIAKTLLVGGLVRLSAGVAKKML